MEDARFSPAAREEIKRIGKAEADLIASERMIARQRVLLEEVRISGLSTIEVENSLARLEAASAHLKLQYNLLIVEAQQRETKRATSLPVK